jgi:DNA helicase HerA-like ATPase
MTDTRTRLLAARQKMIEQLTPDPAATSIDGRTFTYVAPVDFSVPIGGYVEIVTKDDRHFLGLLTSKHAEERSGPQVKLAGDGGLLGEDDPAVAESVFALKFMIVQGGGRILSQLDGDVFAQTGPDATFDGAAISLADPARVANFLESTTRGKAPLDIGSIRNGTVDSRATLQATGFDRHTFLCGQSGSGKTYALGVVLERLLLETDLRIVILDPNSDFVNLGAARPFEAAARGFSGQIDSSESYEPHRARYESAASGVTVLRPAARGTDPDNALRIRFSNLPAAIQGMVLKLDPLADQEEFNAFLSIRERLSSRNYTIADIRHEASYDLSPPARSLALRISNLGIGNWDVWAEPHERPLLDSGNIDSRALVLDIGSYGNPDEQSLISLALLSHLWSNREQRKPILVVIDEAHTVCPSEPMSVMQEAATKLAVQIAGEGRKFGIYLLVSTQRPAKLHPNVISQCDNLFLMRMNSEADIAQLASIFSFVPSAMLAESAGFAQGESLIAGKVVPAPIMTRFGGRFSQEGGGDVPTEWARPS